MNIQNMLVSLSERVNRKFCLGVAAALVVISGAGFVWALPSSSGLVAHWSFDQSSGTVLTDNSGNGHTGSFSGTPTWAAGKINNALTFDGTDNVALGNVTQINNVSKLTLATWVKRASAGANVFVGKQATNQDVAIEAYSDGKIYFQMSKGADTYGSINLNDTAWHHVALVFDGTLTGNASRLKAYVDGVQKTLAFHGTVGTATTANTTPFNVGKMGSEYSNGQIDDTWLYARALSLAEVQDLMQIAAPDTTAPTIPTGLGATAVSSSQINLSWTASSDNVGVTGYRVYRNGVAQGTSAGTSYQDTGLTASTPYNYTVRAYDAANNQSADSATASATTQAPPPVPAVGITATPSNVALGGSSTLDWTSTNATSCSASGAWSGAKATSGSQVVSGITTPSTYTLTCTGAGGQTAASATVTPDPDTTVPTVSLSSPADGATVSGTVPVSATAADNVSVASVAFAVDGVQQGANDTSAPYGFSLDTTALGNGPHTIRATAYDTSNNSAYAEVTVTVDNQPDATPPAVAVSAPADGATVSGSVAFNASASDNVGVAGVKFYANGTQIGNEVTAAPYGLSWDTTGVANGSVQMTTVARDAAGNTTTSMIVTVTVNNVVQTGPKFIAGNSANGRYFVDQTGAPILIKGDSPWALFSNLSPAELELWAANRESRGFNAAIISLIECTTNGGMHDNGATYDNIVPFNGGNITSWNEAYWSRMDSYLTTLKNHGITAFLYPLDGWNTKSGGAFYHKSNADVYTFSQMLATRYASYPNIVWMAGGDYQWYDDPIVNQQFPNMLAGIRAAGDNRPFSIQHTYGSLSTDIAAYEPLATWNFAYTYSITYQTVLKGYNRAPSSRDPRPVVMGESNYEREDNIGGPPTTNETLRRQQLWSLTSGAAGEFTGSNDWGFNAGWQSRLDTVWIGQAQKIRSLFAGLNWQQLVPDEALPLVTAGRGTKITNDSSLDVLQNDYVTAAQTPDKSLAMVYVPTSVGNTNARTITLDLTRLPAGYTATWVDPTDATATQVASINGSGQVTTPGLHSDGTRDWLLLIRL